MKDSRSCFKSVIGIALLFGGLAVVALFVYTFASWRVQGQSQVQIGPPIVYVSSPLSGMEVPPGDVVVIPATITGSRPIQRAELWVDGKLIETQENDALERTQPFFVNFGYVAMEGQHLLIVRGVDTAGLIGQSLPITIYVSSAVHPEETHQGVAVYVDEGDTWESIAETRQVDFGQLKELNPNIDGQNPPPGSIIIVPSPPNDNSLPPAPLAPPAPGIGNLAIPAFPMLQVVTAPNILDNFTLFEGTPPKGPIDLQGQVDGCDVILTWNDQADNETRYEVWYAWSGVVPRVVASLKPSSGTGPAWFKFAAPQAGYIPFWVEAVNSEGSQPSSTITLHIDDPCNTPESNYLQVEVFDMTVQGGYDRVYCYASYEGVPEQRIPEYNGEFVQVSGSKADFSAQAAGYRSKIIPIPSDGELNIIGKCLGWAGQNLDNLGTFSGSFTVNDWDGARRVIQGAGYQIEFAIRPWNQAAASIASHGMYGYLDPTLQFPHDLSITHYWSPPRADSLERILSWKWDGDPQSITGFVVFLNGVPYKAYEGSSLRQVYVQEPGFCGSRVDWQVAAVNGPVHSTLSTSKKYSLLPCYVFAEVWFKSLEIHCSDTDDFNPVCITGGGPTCDTITVFTEIFEANDQITNILTWNNTKEYSGCETYKIIGNPWAWPPEQIRMIVPIYASDPSLRLGSRIYRKHSLGEHRMFQGKYQTITMLIDEWKNYEGEITLKDNCFNSCGVRSTLTIQIRGFEGTLLP
jgi:hypothetical protein